MVPTGLCTAAFAARSGRRRRGPYGKTSYDQEIILLAGGNETFHTNPKRQRGNDLATSLTLRVNISRDRGQYNHEGHEAHESKSGQAEKNG
jgi:hypothetical protein